MTASLRERLAALRAGAGSRPAAPPARPASVARPAGPGGACGPDVVVTRVRLPPDGHPDAEALRRLAPLVREPSLPGLRPEGLLFLDLETTGLSLGAGTLAFVLGVAWLEPAGDGADLVVEQHLLRALSHERAALEAVLRRVEGADALVTFNGKSYDVPLLASRCVLHRLAAPPPRPHLDALHPARRLLCHALADVRLVTLESALWGEEREDDLAGAAVPAAFFAALRGDDGLLDDVLRHNLGDLVTLARLPRALAGLVAGGATATGVRADPLVLADVRVRQGDRAGALEAVRTCPVLAGSPRSVRRARLARRAGGPEAARDYWAGLCRLPRSGLEPHVELAKILEHHDRDPAAALAVVEEALRRFGDGPGRAELEHRRARLLRRAARAGGGFHGTHHPR